MQMCSASSAISLVALKPMGRFHLNVRVGRSLKDNVTSHKWQLVNGEKPGLLPSLKKGRIHLLQSWLCSTASR